MEVKTGQLRDQLSRYLKRVRQTGEAIVVLDRNKPVAEIRPYSGDTGLPERSPIWTCREEFLGRYGQIDEDFSIPERHTDTEKHANPLD